MKSPDNSIGTITAEQEQAIRKNIFRAAHSAIRDWSTFKWHRTKGVPDAHVPHSSQAFCISVWGTVASPQGAAVRKTLNGLLNDDLIGKALESYKEGLPLELESDSRELLNEYGGTQSHLDGVLRLNGLIVVIESKLTEPLGRCSQAKDGHCSGIYGPGSDLKRGRTDVACRLEYQDRQRTARLYWNIMKKISKEDAYPVGETCAFAGSGYQVMRNIAAAAKLAADASEWRVIFAYPRSYDPKTDDAITSVRSKLAVHQDRVVVLDYINFARQLTSSSDEVAHDLGKHMAIRLGLDCTDQSERAGEPV
jgi:hypothetical protein